MKLVTFSEGAGTQRGGVLLPGLVIDLQAAALLAFEEEEGRHWDVLGILSDEEGLNAAAEVVEAVLAQVGDELDDALADPEPSEAALAGLAGSLSIGGAEMLLPLSQVRLLAPLPRPASLRDFYAFEQHVATAYHAAGRHVPPEWYDIPVFYFGNHGAIFGPDAEIPMPQSRALDYELELACVIGRVCRDVQPEDADQVIAGYTILNDWSARDLQREEMRVGLGPAKGKDFATSLGPAIVTLDELFDYALPDGRHNLTMLARVSGEQRSHGNARDSYYTFGELIARASRDCTLYPGDVIGSGTVGSGCLLELTGGQGPWLQVGDVVELEISGLGVLRNTIV
jgi:fumarylacetoacetate (FAA) hydrolase